MLAPSLSAAAAGQEILMYAPMMLDVLGEEKYANKIENAVIKTAQQLDSLSAGKMGMGTSEVGDMVKDFILNDEE